MKVRYKAAHDKSNQASTTRWRLSARNAAFLASGMVLAFLLNYFFPTVFSKTYAARKSRPSLVVKPASQIGNRWGALEITPIVLERPEEYFASDPPPPPRLAWFFGNYSMDRLVEMLRHSGLTDSQQAALRDTSRWKVAPQGIWIEPPLEVVRTLEPSARERLYRVLAEHRENVTQQYPFVYRQDGFDEWFAACELPPEKVELIRKMIYPRNGVLCFSDSQYLQLTLPANEVRALAKTLARVPTLLMTLRVNAQSEVKDLLDYWGNPSRNRSLKPLLESMARVPGGATISVSYFFPPIPQLLVYTYPNPTNLASPKAPDCFWTAMNFFNESPNHQFFDSTYTKQILATDYQLVPKADTFGDVIMLYVPGQNIEVVHMCVYVAAEVVFTKNGADLYQPWVLMRMSDMMVNYPSGRPLQMAVYRHIKR